METITKYQNEINNLTNEDKVRLQALTTGLDTNDFSSIQSYGLEVSTLISQNGDSLLQNVRTDTSIEVVRLITELLSELRIINPDDIDESSWRQFLGKVPILRKFITSIDNMMDKYSLVSDNINKIMDKINLSKDTAINDNQTLQSILDSDMEYVNQINDLILAGKLKLNSLKAELAELTKTEDSVKINHLQNFINIFEKRVSDLIVTQYMLTQNIFQIKATQSNNLSIVDKADNINNHVIPVWKNQIALSLIINNQRKAVEAQKKITEVTNELLTKNAEFIKINSIEVATNSEESIISQDTLKNTAKLLIETVNEVQKIHEKGVENRKAIEASISNSRQLLLKGLRS